MTALIGEIKGVLSKMETMTWEEYLQFLKDIATTKEELDLIESLKGEK